MRSLHLYALANCVAVVFVAAASAQTHPYARDPYAAQSYAPANGQYVMDYPAADVRAVPPAWANLVHARGMQRRAERSLDNALSDMQRRLEKSDEWKTALAEERDAYANLQAARERALAQLASNENHRVAMALVSEYAQQIEILRSVPHPDQQRILSLARQKMRFAATAREIESSILNSDRDVQQARTRLVSAGNRVSELREELADRIRSDDRLVSARRELEDARIGLSTADAYFVGVVEARDIAMNYAYFLHQYDYIRYASQGGGYSYPYGNYSSIYPYGLRY